MFPSVKSYVLIAHPTQFTEALPPSILTTIKITRTGEEESEGKWSIKSERNKSRPMHAAPLFESAGSWRTDPLLLIGMFFRYSAKVITTVLKNMYTNKPFCSRQELKRIKYVCQLWQTAE